MHFKELKDAMENVSMLTDDKKKLDEQLADLVDKYGTACDGLEDATRQVQKLMHKLKVASHERVCLQNEVRRPAAPPPHRHRVGAPMLRGVASQLLHALT